MLVGLFNLCWEDLSRGRVADSGGFVLSGHQLLLLHADWQSPERNIQKMCGSAVVQWSICPVMLVVYSGWPWFGSVQLQFLHRTVRAVSVCASDDFSGPLGSGRFLSAFRCSFIRKARFRFGSLENGSGGSDSVPGNRFRQFRFGVPVRAIGHPVY